MVDKKPSPFAGLDKALLRSTRPGETPPASQQDSKPVSQDTGKPVTQLVKATFYLSPEQIVKLEQLRLARLQQGEKIDKSALVREAIELLTSKTA